MDHERVKEKFISIVGKEHVKSSYATRLAYSYDATPHFQALPDFVVSPRNTKEVSKIVKFCNQENIPVVPRGSGTNLCAATTPLHGGVVLTFQHMNQIVEIDSENLTVTVEPGVITKDIDEAVRDMGLFYPPDPSSMHVSQIGGNIGANSGGLRGLKYGVTKDYVLGLEVVLPNGEVITTGGKLAKDVAGYDLTSLFVGSEGTLGIITQAILKLLPRPETKGTMLALYQNIELAAESVSEIIAHKIIPATLEFLDQMTTEVVEDYAKIGLPTEAEAILIIEQDGTEDLVKRDLEKIAEICRKNGAFEIKIAPTIEEGEELLTARRSALTALSRLRPTTILEDATVPRSKVADMVIFIQQIAKKYNLRICTFGHAGDGNLHPTCLTDSRDEEEMKRVNLAFEEIFLKAVELGGTITGEHGVGMVKAPYLPLKVGEAGIEVMQRIKSALDPKHMMNPGKIFSEEGRPGGVMRS